MREPVRPDIRDSYERPNQKWVCGLVEEGPPCPLGPTGSGVCSHGTACHPRRDGDRWICNRSVQRGGPCEKGPSPEGECCLQYSCSPVRSLRSRRGRFVWILSLATIGGLCLVLSSKARNDFIAPGPLSVHHGQLVAQGDDQTERCSSCHAAGNQSFVEWLSHVTETSLAASSQSQLCLDCHGKEIPRETALLAHGIAAKDLFHADENKLGNRRIDPHGLFACSTCHREHHGPNFDLKAMSNSACQACHREQYWSFATDHPEFEGWPETRRTRIAFDHAAHHNKHFPTEKQGFDCGQCHQITANGFEATLGFQESCAKCHESDIQVSLNPGIGFISLPMIDTEALADSGHKIERWPDEATGDFDGALPILSKFLVMSDDESATSLETLGTDFDFFDVDPADARQLASAAPIIAELTALADDLTENGHGAIRKRVEKLIARELTPAELQAAVAHLSFESMSDPSSRWLAGEAVNPRNDSPELLAAGAWLSDDETYTLRYLPVGHDDLFLAAWIDILAAATRGPQPKLAEKLLNEMMKPTAPGMCGSCHSVDHDPRGGFVVNWLAKQSSSGLAFTFFSHKPHVLQSGLADCKVCHRFVEDADVMSNYAQTNPSDFDAGFHALTRQQCATCHKPGAAGDSCTQCHRYHVTALHNP